MSKALGSSGILAWGESKHIKKKKSVNFCQISADTLDRVDYKH